MEKEEVIRKLKCTRCGYSRKEKKGGNDND